MGEIYAWEKVYQDAFGETDVRNLHERIIAAETILIARGQQISHSAIGNGYEQRERRALQQAAEGLRRLKLETMKSPGRDTADSMAVSARPPRPPLNFSKYR
jgi:hypothetical protein